LVDYRLEDIVMKGAWTGPATLELEPHALAPIAELPVRRKGTLRVEPAKNCQRKFVRPASEYEIGRVKVHAPDSVSD